MRMCLLLLLLSVGPSFAGEAVTIRIGTLAFGTLAWELAAMQNEPPGRSFAIEAVSLANAEAGKIALQGGSVDLIVTDWIWSAEQRGHGLEYAFHPYSTSHGALLVPPQSAIRTVAGLKGKRLGIAGGSLDKNWLLLRAYAKKAYGLDLERDIEKVFAAPPLLNQQLAQGRLDAVLNYWNFAARLEAQGYRRLLDGRALLDGLGIGVEVPALGYVFRESWARAHADALAAFLDASAAARNRLCSTEAAWNQVAPLIQETDAAVRAALRRQYCAGRVQHWGEAERQAIGDTYRLMGAMAGQEKGEFPAGLFWNPPSAATRPE